MGFLPRLQHLEVLDDGHILKRDVLKWKRENVVSLIGSHLGENRNCA